MATCGSLSLWCALSVLAAVASIGMSQNSGGSQLTPSPGNCTAYNSNITCNFPDLAQKLYCLANGSFVTGYCEAHEAVCGNHASLREDAFCSSSKESSTTTSKTSTTGSSTAGSKVSQHSHTDDHDHDHKGEHHEKDSDNAAPLSHTPGHVVVLCGVTAVAYASRLFALL